MIPGIPGGSSRLGGNALTPRRIAVLYALFGFGLLAVSDLLLPVWLSGSTLREIQGAKGAVEVLVSAGLIYVLVASAQRELRLKDRAMDEVPVGITIADARREDDPLVYVNEGFEAVTGYDESEALGRNCRFLQGEGTAPEPVARLREAIDAERPVSVELLNYRRDGTPFWNQVTVVPFDGDGDGTTHYLGVQRDVTASTERKQRLAVLNRILRHNIRNKLNVIRGRLDHLEGADGQGPDRGDPPDRASDDAGRAIREATDDLLALADQVREFDAVLAHDDGSYDDSAVGPRARAGFGDVEEVEDVEDAEEEEDAGADADGTVDPFHRVDLAAVVRTVAADVRARDAGATLDVETPETAPVAVRGTLEPAIETLLELAVEDVEAAATVSVRDEDDAVVVAVRDRGGSISATDLDVVARGTETPLEHLLDLDLWLVRWATERSRGEFSVDASGEAPVVSLRFPRAGPPSVGPDPDHPSTE